MKKIFTAAFASIILLAGIGTMAIAKTSAKANSKNGSKIKVVATIFPAYDWAKEVIGKNDADLTMLLSKGVDLHSYQPTVQDIVKISESDVFIYVGGESDGWVKDALKNVRNKNIQVVNMMEVMGDRAKAEEVKEGMEAEHEHEHEHDHDAEHHDAHDHDHDDDEEEEELDEHVWLSLRNAQLLTSAISVALQKADAKNAASYKANCLAYNKQLAALDAQYESAVKAASKKTLVFADRFPFRYLTDDYGLDYFAAFVGCSAETEASFKTVMFLANKSDQLGVNNLLVIENSDQKIAKTVNKNSKNKNRGILVMDSMQATDAKAVKGGATYLKSMQANLEVLKQALN